jgi:hypothetical protein
MTAAICTLFEGDYHYGVAALSNSLYNKGFRGTIYVGYRGKLPEWATGGESILLSKWAKSTLLTLSKDFRICFLLLDTDYSLTNYKPNFIIDLLEYTSENIESIYYFDPDIVISKPWSYYREWIQCGLALCEDINSPLSEFHPRRVVWRNYFRKYNITLTFKNSIYVNGGFIGVKRSDIEFLKIWKDVQDYMAEEIGGLENSIFSNQSYNSTIPKRDGFQIFDKSDQDALNAAIEVYNGNISFLGLESMGFKSGEHLMLHALGSPKPWNTNLLLRALNGRPPRIVDEYYWKKPHHPILAHTRIHITIKKISLYLSKMIGRFYRV